MQAFESTESIFRQQPSKPAHNGLPTQFTHGAFNTSYYPGFRDMAGSTISALSTGRNPQTPLLTEMQTPGTAYDMNFTPLLPSQLLMGSPFQPGSPSTFASPHFHNFPTFTSSNNAAQAQQQTTQLNNALQAQQGMPSHHFHALAPSAMVNAQQYLQGSQTSGNSYMSYANTFVPQANATSSLTSGGNRTVYLGNIPPDTSAEEILGHVRCGPIESMRLLPDKNCAFISFLDDSPALHFHSDAILKKLSIRGQDIKVGWGKPSPVPAMVSIAVQQSGASRNVYLGNLPTDITEEEIHEDLSRFGPIDIIKLVREKSIGFVHFLSIASALKAVSQLPSEEKWQPPRRVYYGKDRCAYVSKTQQQNAAQYLGLQGSLALNPSDREAMSNMVTHNSITAAAVATTAGGASNIGNRTVYLGNIHPETSLEEICNVIRGGLLHHIRYIPEKHICFVTFIDPTSAASFYAVGNVHGFMIHNRRLKVGWGKHSGALPQPIALAVSGGASRNVYIGNIDESWSEERLRQDFQEYGETELVNTLREKSCAFVNFTNIANAIKAIEGVKEKEEYKHFKVNFGKDRCGNTPRQMFTPAQLEYYQQPLYQQSQDGTNSPHGNGAYHPNRGSQNNNNISPVGLGVQRVQPMNYGQGQNGSMNQSYINGSTNNPIGMYLTQFSDQNQQQQQPQSYLQMPNQSFLSNQQHSNRQNSFASQNGGYLESGLGTPSYGRNGSLNVPNQYATHGNSVSFNVPPSGGYTSVGGLLAPSNMGAAARAQHSRAISLPAFSQAPFNAHQQQQHQSEVKFEGLGLGSESTSNGYGLAIQHNGLLNGWAEEDMA